MDFKRVFGFDKPDRFADRTEPDDELTYGSAAYGAWNDEHPERIFWAYEVGTFDFVWGGYQHLQGDPRTLALALYILDSETKSPTRILDQIALSPERKRRYGDDYCKFGTVMVDLILEPDDYDGIPEKDFRER